MSPNTILNIVDQKITKKFQHLEMGHCLVNLFRLGYVGPHHLSHLHPFPEQTKMPMSGLHRVYDGTLLFDPVLCYLHYSSGYSAVSPSKSQG